jgi:hypothetical protein
MPRRSRPDVVARAMTRKARSQGIRIEEDGSFMTKGSIFDPDTGTFRDPAYPKIRQPKKR